MLFNQRIASSHLPSTPEAAADSSSPQSTPLGHLRELFLPKAGVLAISLTALLQEVDQTAYASQLESAGVVQSVSGLEVSELVVSGRSFTAKLGAEEIGGSIDEQQCISSFSLRGRDCELKRPASLEKFSAVAEAFHLAISVDHGNFVDEIPVHFVSHDGINFEFTGAGDTRGVIQNGQVAYLVSDHPETGIDREALEAKLTAKHSEISETIEKHLTTEQQVEFKLRALSSDVSERVTEVEKQIRTQLKVLEAIPFSCEQWEDYLASFQKKVETPYKAALNLSGSASSEVAAFEKVADALTGFEKSLSISPDHPNSYSPEELIQIAERIERAEALNARRTALMEVVRGRQAEATDSEVRKNWKDVEEEFFKGWNMHINSWGQEYGWDRWDPAILSQEEHRSIIVKLDAHLSQFEEQAGIQEVVRDAVHAGRYRMAELEIAAQRKQCEKPPATEESFLTANGVPILKTERGDSNQLVSRSFNTTGGKFKQTFEDGALVIETTTDKERNEKVSRHFNSDGRPTDTFVRREGKVCGVIKHHSNGEVYYHSSAAGTDFYTRDGTRVVSLGVNLESGKLSRYTVYGEDGLQLGMCSAEIATRQGYSTRDYIRDLAKVLKTNESKHIFLDSCMRYTSDNGEHWQRPSETVMRVKNGRMLGDCDDYAFLMRGILRHQGMHAHVLHIPDHALCIWITKKQQGDFNCRTIGTFGYDFNGVRYGDEITSEALRGFESVQDAVNATMAKYRFPGLGLAEGQDYKVNGSVSIMKIGTHGDRRTANWSTNSILQKDL